MVCGFADLSSSPLNSFRDSLDVVDYTRPSLLESVSHRIGVCEICSSAHKHAQVVAEQSNWLLDAPSKIGTFVIAASSAVLGSKLALLTTNMALSLMQKSLRGLQPEKNWSLKKNIGHLRGSTR